MLEQQLLNLFILLNGLFAAALAVVCVFSNTTMVPVHVDVVSAKDDEYQLKAGGKN